MKRRYTLSEDERRLRSERARSLAAQGKLGRPRKDDVSKRLPVIASPAPPPAKKRENWQFSDEHHALLIAHGYAAGHFPVLCTKPLPLSKSENRLVPHEGECVPPPKRILSRDQEFPRDKEYVP